jgi:hypothetical protein
MPAAVQNRRSQLRAAASKSRFPVSAATPGRRSLVGCCAALITRLDTNPTKADWAAYGRELEARIAALLPG